MATCHVQKRKLHTNLWKKNAALSRAIINNDGRNSLFMQKEKKSQVQLDVGWYHSKICEILCIINRRRCTTFNIWRKKRRKKSFFAKKKGEEGRALGFIFHMFEAINLAIFSLIRFAVRYSWSKQYWLILCLISCDWKKEIPIIARKEAWEKSMSKNSSDGWMKEMRCCLLYVLFCKE